MEDLKLFIPGPTFLSKKVIQASILPAFGHRDKEINLRLGPAFENLRKIMQVDDSYEIALIPGTGSTGMEAAIRSLVKDDETVLCVSVGAFGKLFEKIARNNKSNVEALEFEPGKEINPKILEKKIREAKPAVVVFTHNETSTGVMNDVAALGKLIRRYNALPVVDGVSIMGGAPTNIVEGKIAMYCASTQKCLGLPAGFGIVAISKDAIEKAEQVPMKGYSTNILFHLEKARKNQTLTTTSTTLANQLMVQTDHIVNHEGIEERFERHERMQKMVLKWVQNLPDGFELLPDKNYASKSVTCIRVPESLDREGLKEKMREHGYLTDKGYSKLKIPTIRIPHMGEITEEMLEKYLEVLKKEIALDI